jgi:NTE family protein
LTRGLDITPLKELLVEIVDEKRIRESEVDFGLVTFSLSDFKPVRLFKSDIPEGKLTDYLLASSCFPAFKRHEVDSKKFIDGGVYDNIPVSMAVDRGIKNIIAVDVSGPGLTRKVDTKNLNIITIKNSEDLGGVLNFSGERSKTNIELGYLDALKAFGHLKGNKYYIVPSEEFKENKDLYIKSLGIDDFKKMYIYLGMDWSGKSTTSNRLIIEKVMRTIGQYTQDKLSGDTVFPAMAEIAAEQLGIDRRRKYSLNN